MVPVPYPIFFQGFLQGLAFIVPGDTVIHSSKPVWRVRYISAVEALKGTKQKSNITL
jgi:hypothetical protein